MYLNKLILFVATNLFAIVTLVAQPNIEWQTTLGGTDSDAANDVEQTADGGYIVAGVSRSTDGDVTVNHGWMDYWVVKLANDGTIEWEKSYGGTNHDIASDILQTSDGGYIVAGRADSEDGQITDHRGSTDFWVVKLTSDGMIEWEKSLGGSGSDYAYAIYQTSDGGYVVGGASDSQNGDVTGNHGDYDYWVVKLASDGALEWEKSLGGSKDDFLYSIEQTSEGGYIVAGKSQSQNGDVTGNHGGGNFVHDYWVVKLSNIGEIEWEKSLGGTDHEVAYSVRQTSDGTYVVAGFARSTDGDVTGNHGGWDYWIVKLATNGDIEWQKSIGGTDDDLAHSIQITNDGGYIAVGSSKSTWGEVTGNHGGQDFWIVKITSTGEIDWQKSMGGSNAETAFSVQQTDEDGYIITGQTQSNNGDVSGNHGSNDYWVVKLGPCGVNTELEMEEQTIQSLETALSSTFQWINCNDGTVIAGEESSSFSPDIGGDYAVILSNGSCLDTSACISYCPLNVDVIVNANTIQATEDSPNVTYQWIDCSNGAILEGEVYQIFEPSINGEYAVIITDGNCSTTSECRTVCPESINTEVITIVSTIQSLADTLNSTFQWIDCNDATLIDGQTGHLFTPTTSGDYAVIVNQGICFDTSECITVCQVDTNIFVIENTIQSLADTLSSTFQWIDCSDGTPIDDQTGHMFTPITSGEYAVVVSQGNCVDTSACITVCLIDTNVSVIENTIQSLADTLSSTFQWIDCSDGTPIVEQTNQMFAPTASGEYAVVVNQGNCVDTSDCINVLIVGLEEPINHSIKVFPNPVREFVLIETDTKMIGSIYTIYDTGAKKVSSGRIETTDTIVRLNGLPNGLYMIKLESSEEVVTIKFIKS